VGVISNAGFECSTVTDALDGLRLATFGPDVRAALDEALPSFAHRDNPVDATPMAPTKAYDAAVAAVCAGDEVDAMIISAVPVTPALDNLPADPDVHREDVTGERSQAASFVRHLGASPKPSVVVVDSGPMYDPLTDAIESKGIPVFRKIDRASRALARFIAVRTAKE
jgi:acyl-CoA synthetase (NDP forming)